MNSKYNNLLEQLTTGDIIQLVGQFGIPETSIRYYNNQLIMPTGCHNELPERASHKLYYYEDSKKFHCFTCCGSMNPYEFIVQAYRARGIKYSLSNAYIILDRIVKLRLKEGFSIISKEVKAPVIEEDWKAQLTEYNISIMDSFSRNKKYLKIWEKEGISYETMGKFGTKFDMIRNRMVIPIFNHKGAFVGAKVRNFNPEEIENGRKYMPLIHNKDIYTYNRGKVLYGLNLNKRAIKSAKRAIIFEAEKSTLIFDSLFVGNRAVSLGGSSVSPYQIELLQELGVETVVLALDNDYALLPDENGNRDKFYGLYKALKEANRLKTKGFVVEVIYDWEQEFLEEKDAPIDKGREVWNKLYRSRRNFDEMIDEHSKKGEDNERIKVEVEDF